MSTKRHDGTVTIMTTLHTGQPRNHTSILDALWWMGTHSIVQVAWTYEAIIKVAADTMTKNIKIQVMAGFGDF